ncbi:MAG: hypothetical protein NC548_61950 [Lachnospiraceae bacterium]|nr:hypothetical protein [Lachnospiraceae bacterium]
MFYGRDGFKKDRSDIAYHFKMDITGSACGIETDDWNGKIVPAIISSCYEDYTNYGKCFCRQTVKEVVNMWMLKFYKAYARNKKLKRMLAYSSKLK